MDATFTIVLAAGAAAILAGALSAGTAGPVRMGWRDHPITTRLNALRRAAPGRARRALGGGVLAVTLGSGALAVYAAQPSAPERLPSQVVGVVGSGDQLSLRLRTAPGAPETTLKIGGTYAEDWTLKGLTNTEAVLERGTETRRVGLNPTGAVMEQEAAGDQPVVTRLLSSDDLAMIEAARAEGFWNGQPIGELTTLAETRRRVLYSLKIREDSRRAGAVSPAIGTGLLPVLLGQADYNDLRDLVRRSGPMPDFAGGRTQVFIAPGEAYRMPAGPNGAHANVRDGEGGIVVTRIPAHEIRVQTDPGIGSDRPVWMNARDGGSRPPGEPLPGWMNSVIAANGQP